MTDDTHCRYIAAYDDPTLDDDIVVIRYPQERPRDTLSLYNPEDGRRECGLIDYVSLGGWTPVSEACERLDGGIDGLDLNDEQDGDAR